MESQIRKRKGTEEHRGAQIRVEADSNAVCIHLSDVNRSEGFPDRIITLKHPDWLVEIGRGSSSDVADSPKPANVWFTSKVMSRHHAELKADPKTRMLMIKDKGSMHGTLLNGTRVPMSGLEVLPDDIITFGTQIVAKDNTFSPLKTSVSYEWAEDDTPQLEARQSSLTNTTNTFTADYSDADIYSEYDDEIEVVGESARQPSVEVLQQTSARPAATSSTNSSPRTGSERRTSSSITAPTDSSSVVDDAENKQKDEDVTPAKARVLPVFDDGESDTADSPHHPPGADSAPGDNYAPAASDVGSGLSYNPSENNPELCDFEEEYDDGDGYDQDEDADDEEHDQGDGLPSESPLVVPAQTCCSSNIPISAPLREPSPSDAAMAKPRPSSPSPKRYPALLSMMGPPPPPITPRPRFGPPFPLKLHDLSGSSSAQTLEPLSDTQIPFMCAPPYQNYPPYPTISNNGPLGYGITSYDPYDITQSAAPPTFQSPRPSLSIQPMNPSPPNLVSYAAPKTPFWWQSTNEAPRCCQPNATMKRKADEMSCDGEDEDWSSDEQGEDLDKAPSLKSSLISPRSSVWRPGSPEIPRLQVDVAAQASEPQTTVSDAVSGAKGIPDQLEPVEPEVTTVKLSTSVAEEAEVQVQPVKPFVPATQNEAVLPPPQKKIKITESEVQHASSTAKKAMKYAAVALAGGAAGAMGTIYALASLPPDYFVSAI